mmetsp:Transcript_58862/g.65940  ORF Transcript_58862/g.65940 Transcript_58862/m.65940 type:complete len:570 (+) Transcript_58862:182-1891(+)
MDGKKQSFSNKNPVVYVTVLNDNDVLQGRGSGSMQNTGNIRFRTMVEELRPAYVATSSRKEKAKMITGMVKLIQSRLGRFLQPVNDSQVEELGLSSNTEHFVEMTDDEAAEKAKQAIRYVHYKKVPLEDKRRKKRAAVNDPQNDDSGLFSSSLLRGGNDNSNREDNKRIYNGGWITNNMPMLGAISLPDMVNQGGGIQSQQMASIPGMNINSVAHFNPQLQQAQLGQMLASLQDTKPSVEPNQGTGRLQSHAQKQQASLLGTLQPNVLQQLTSSLLSTNNFSHPASTTPTAQQTAALLNTSVQNNQQNLQQQPHQLNVLLQNLLQQNQSQQPNLQPDASIIQSLLQQQQQQQLLGALQQQQQLNSTIQSLQQSQQLNSEPNPMLTMLSNTNQTLAANSALSSLINQSLSASTTNQQSLPPPQQQQPPATNSFLSSLLSNSSSSSSTSNILQSNPITSGTSAFLSPTPLSSPPGADMMVNREGQVMGGRTGQNGNNVQTVPGLGNTILPDIAGINNNNNNTQTVTTMNGSTLPDIAGINNNNTQTVITMNESTEKCAELPLDNDNNEAQV